MAKPIDWTHLFEKHRGQWVALAEDEVTVLGSGATAREAHAAGLKHTKLPILFQVPKTLDLFVGHAL